MLDTKAIINQSKNAYSQWAKQWREHAKINSQYEMKPLTDFENTGVGKAVLCIANGFSFEENLETIKKYQGNVDILACDKTLGHCLDNGIIPTYLVLCDANVSYELYMEKWKDQLQNTILFSNVCANPKWTENGNWKDKYFFVNMDVIDSHVEFSKLSGCNNQIPAATNVSNAMVVFLTQSDNNGRRNFFGYDKILLIGFDYSWRYGGKYYAFDPDGSGKNNYMRHMNLIDFNGNLAYTSNNLAFSAKWLEKYLTAFNLPVVQCTKNTVLSSKYHGSLEEQMQYNFKQTDKPQVKKIMKIHAEASKALKQAEDALHKIGRDHYMGFLRSV